MSDSKFASAIREFVLKTLWPWFKKDILPLVEKHAMQVVDSVLQSLSKKLGEFIDGRMRPREEQARDRAAAADEAAKVASTKEARSEAEAIARVWREVAEQFRQENDVLKVELDQSMSKAYESARAGIEYGEPVLTEREGQLTLVVGGQETALPALPAATPKTVA